MHELAHTTNYGPATAVDMVLAGTATTLAMIMGSVQETIAILSGTVLLATQCVRLYRLLRNKKSEEGEQ